MMAFSRFFKSEGKNEKQLSPQIEEIFPNRSSKQDFQEPLYSRYPSQPQVFVLPYPPPPYFDTVHYQNSTQPSQRQQNSDQPSNPTGEGTFQSARQDSVSQPESSNPQKTSQQGQLKQYQPAPPAPQTFYGYYPAQPHPQNVQYAYQYPSHPQAAQADSASIRPGQRPRQPTPEQIENPATEGWTGFEDKEVRAAFIRKVYAILMLQLLFTMGIIALFVFEPNVNSFVRENKYLIWVSYVIFVAVLLVLFCIKSVRRKCPGNFIALCVLTLSLSYMTGAISSYYETDVIFMAVGVCAAVCLAVSVFSFYTKFDFTSCGGIICILIFVLFGFFLIAIFIQHKVMTMIYAAIGVVVFSLLLAFNTQMMIGGKNYELSPEEYIFAAVQLYIDIVNIFMYLLILFGAGDSS